MINLEARQQCFNELSKVLDEVIRQYLSGLITMEEFCGAVAFFTPFIPPTDGLIDPATGLSQKR